ncbi:hypothetical protein H9Q70_001710 [Fusarium xylarioides]|nr:hypothetical protein H9Q70_001710 [Fusarium xylarioides]KAG5784686.1 hypothetical protein H9Q73_001668 [Fusarium xylarioides]
MAEHFGCRLCLLLRSNRDVSPRAAAERAGALLLAAHQRVTAAEWAEASGSQAEPEQGRLRRAVEKAKKAVEKAEKDEARVVAWCPSKSLISFSCFPLHHSLILNISISP